jgi:protein SCO1
VPPSIGVYVEAGADEAGKDRSPLAIMQVVNRWMLLPLVAIVAIAGGVTFALAQSGGKSSPKLPNHQRSTKSAQFQGALATPPKPAPPTTLDDYQGHRVTLSADKGKVVLLTFLYVHCPDVCPLIAANLHTTLTKLGPLSSRVRVVAVSVDPRGDKPKAVAAFLKAHQMTGKMQYLVGSAATLGRVWKDWNVGSQRDASNPEFVAHSGLVYGIAASGKVTTLYPANFQPSQIAHDVPLLLKR